MKTNTNRKPILSPGARVLLYGFFLGMGLGMLFTFITQDLAFYAIGLGLGLIAGVGFVVMLETRL